MYVCIVLCFSEELTPPFKIPRYILCNYNLPISIWLAIVKFLHQDGWGAFEYGDSGRGFSQVIRSVLEKNRKGGKGLMLTY